MDGYQESGPQPLMWLPMRPARGFPVGAWAHVKTCRKLGGKVDPEFLAEPRNAQGAGGATKR